MDGRSRRKRWYRERMDSDAVDTGAAAPGAAEADGAVTAQARAILARLERTAVAEHAEIFAEVHTLLQDALSDAAAPSS